MLFSSPAIPDSLYVDATENTNCISIILIDFNLRSGVRIMIPYEHLRSTHCIAKKTKDFDLGKKKNGKREAAAQRDARCIWWFPIIFVYGCIYTDIYTFIYTYLFIHIFIHIRIFTGQKLCLLSLVLQPFPPRIL